MSLNRYISLLTTLLISTAYVFGAVTFKESSVLAEGKWIKIEIEETGLYSLGYDLLREMGFESPENVGVYGKGGRLINLNFSPSSSATQRDGERFSDDLSQVASYHSGDKLLFWAQGTENVMMEPGSSSSSIPYLENYRRNTYSKTAFYFLSDIADPLQVLSAEPASSSPLPAQNAWGYTMHEVDLEQNSTGTGKLFWGESFKTDGDVKKWNVPTPNMTNGISHLSYQVYTGPSDSFTLRAQCSASAREKVSTVKNSGSNYFFPLKGALAADPYKNARPDTLRFPTTPMDNVEITLSAENFDCDVLSLDYWVLTYPKAIVADPLSQGNATDLYFYKGIKNTAYKIPLAQGLCAWDLTDPKKPRLLSSLDDEPEMATFNIGASTVTPVLYLDPSKSHKQIKNWWRVNNTNIHSLKNEGYKFLIISVPKLRGYAEQIADLHRKHDNIKVLVTTPEEIYNEFSGGVPDPMAYRAVVKMLAPEGLKNLLLFGPGMRNMLLDVEGETVFDRHIAMQHSAIRPSEPSVPAYEFYGVTLDNPNEERLYSVRKDVGVGLLSCETAEEAQRMVKKIERYITNPDKAWMVNESLSIGGLANEHLHDGQAVDIGNRIMQHNVDGGMAHNTLIIDAYGKTESRRLWFDYINRGKLWNVYFGHGGPFMIGLDSKFFTTGDVHLLRNERMGIIFMGGCDFSLPDVRTRGLGESIVLDSEHSMIAAIVSTRTAWSSQNKYLGDTLTDAWLDPDDKSTSPTIGETFAKAKSASNVLNHLSFVLIGDPAIKLPSPQVNINFDPVNSAAPGEKLRLTGKIIGANGQDNEYNGKIVFKLMQPAETLRSYDYETNACRTLVTDEDGNSYYPVVDVPYESTLISSMEAQVKNGSFDAEFTIPAQVKDFMGKTVCIKAGGYDDDRELGAAGAVSFEITAAPAGPGSLDSTPPVINLSYNNVRKMLNIEISDDSSVILNPGAYHAEIDGNVVSLGSLYPATPDVTGNLFEGVYDTSSLDDGDHTFTLKASDIAGNAASQELKFKKTPVTSPLLLTLSSKVGVDRIEGNIEGGHTGILEVVVTDAEGDIIHSNTISGSEFEWDLTDGAGNRVSPGYYRVYARSMEDKYPLYSDSVEFGVLEPISQ